VERYFFDLTVNDEPDPDTVGSEFASPTQAREEAVKFLAEIVKERLGGRDSYHFIVETRDGTGNLIHRAEARFVGSWLGPRAGELEG